jgi:uncharacterized protein with von Willebrand factor type A (vWA) domain
VSFEQSINEILELSKRTEVRAVVETLNSLLERKQGDGRQKDRYDEKMTGYETGSDMERIVASELALPDEMFYLKFAEGGLMMYKREGKRRNKLPIYILIDKSGSMKSMNKIKWAKAVALAFHKEAMNANRDFMLRFFDSLATKRINLSNNTDAITEHEGIKKMAGVKPEGATSISTAINVACSDIKNLNPGVTANVIIITDGGDTFNVEALSALLKDANIDLISVMISEENEALMKISKRYFRIERDEYDRLIAVDKTGK